MFKEVKDSKLSSTIFRERRAGGPEAEKIQDIYGVLTSSRTWRVELEDIGVPGK